MTNILSSLMSSAQGYASSAMGASRRSKGGGEQKDPNIAPMLNEAKRLAKDQNISALEKLEQDFKAAGLDRAYQVFLTSASTPTPEQQRATQEGEAIGKIIARGLGLDSQQQPTADQPVAPTPTVAPPTPAEQAAQQSLIEPGPAAPTPAPTPAPTQNLRRTGPRLRISQVNRAADGSYSIQFNNKSLEGEDYLNELLDMRKITQPQADEYRATLYQLKLNDLVSEVKDIESKTDAQGNAYTHVIFKNGQSALIPAQGATMATALESGTPYVLPNGSIKVFSNEVGTDIPKGAQKVGTMTNSIYGQLEPEEVIALTSAIAEGRIDYRRVNSRTSKILAQLELKEPGRLDFEEQSQTILQGRTEARQRAGIRAVNLTAASQLYDTNMPKLLELRQTVADKGYLPKGPIKSFHALDQWAGEQVSDPDVAEFKGNVLLVSEALQRTFASGQGGEWAFELAKQLIDPALAPEAFERRVRSHSEHLRIMTASLRTFGKTQADFQTLFDQLTKNIEESGGGKSEAQIEQEALDYLNQGGKP